MYRSAARRLLFVPSLMQKSHHQYSRFRITGSISSRFSTTNASEAFIKPSPNHRPPLPQSEPEALKFSDSASSSSASSSFSAKEEARFSEGEASRGTQPRARYQDEQARVLNASLIHVIRMGWTEAALIAGAKDTGVSPSIVGSFPRKEAALVEFFMDECLQKLIDRIDSWKELNNLIPSERIAKLVRARLEMQAPYISNWPQALSIQAQPVSVPTSFKQRAMLVDEIWHAAGDEANDMDWYAKRAALGAIYTATELYMLTDSSPGFHDSWKFLDGRIKDGFDLKKTVQEVQYLAEAVGAGLGGPFQGFIRRVFQN